MRLEMVNFGPFRQPAAVDFEDAELFAFVGPTGAGKSTVIDAICFALYGSVPRYDDQRLVGQAVSMNANEAKVAFTFDVSGLRYVAARVVRRAKDGKVTTKEARLERTVDGKVETVAGNVREMNDEIVKVLGLTFDHFTRSVVLPQGAFARFLHDKPSERQELLVHLLDLGRYSEMARRARSRAVELDAGAKLAEERLAALAFATEETLAAADERIAQVASLAAAVTAAAPEIAELEAAVSAARRDHDVAQALATALAAIEVPAVLEDVLALRRDASMAVDAAADALERAEAAHASATSDPAATADRAQLLAAIAAHDQHAVAQQDVAVAAEARREAEVMSTTAVDGLAMAEASRSGAVAELEALRLAHTAHALSLHLTVGEPCPVCTQEVASVPKTKTPAALSKAEKSVAAAEKAERDARAIGDRAGKALAAAEARHAAALAQLDRIAATLVDGGGRDELEARLALAQTAQKAVVAAREAEAKARKALDQARADLATAEQRLGKGWALFDRQRDSVASLSPPPPDRLDLEGSWKALTEWAAQRAPEVAGRAGELSARIASAGAAASARLDAVRALATSTGVDAPPDVSLDRLRDTAAHAFAGARAERDRVNAAIAERSGLEASLGSTISAAQVARELGRLLDARNFERWLVAEAAHQLCVGASLVLERLSAGQYALALDTNGDFAVVDHANADELRPVRTLSGGETFQASLALALAMADQLGAMAADNAPRLEAIFLDEGFGTLDEATLETVASTIEALATESDRMVGLVTHVRELAERVPVRFVVTKGAATSTIERVVA
ncbi:MAG: AAA family ATPase [Acidimicrobiia bacterium]